MLYHFYVSDSNWTRPAAEQEIERYKSSTEDLGYKVYILHPSLSFGDYDDSSHIERSNVRVFLKKFPDGVGYRHYIGYYGHRAIQVDIKTVTPEITELLDNLDDYSVLDEEDCSKMEMEMEEKDWESMFMSEFKTLLAKKRKVWEEDLEETDEQLWDMYLKLKQEKNIGYQVQRGGNGWIDLKKLLA